MKLLQVNDLRTRLPSAGSEVDAVKGIDFSIDQAETLCLVGESGSGKSVTALSIMRLLPDGVVSHPSGNIELYPDPSTPIGEAATDSNSPWRPFNESPDQPLNLLSLDNTAMSRLRGRHMAMIFQEPMSSLNPVFTVGEQIVEAIEFARPGIAYAEAEAIALEALRDVKLKQPEIRYREYPHKLSGGQRQRVMIAIALACRPRLLIADEPTTALDVTVQAGILELMRELQEKTRMAMLFITHDLGVVAQIADRVAVMQNGCIVEQGTREAILLRPQHPYTRQLLAAVPENLSRQNRPEITPDALMRVEHLGVHFPVRRGLLKRVVSTIKAVDDVSLDIWKGEILALVGESGSGKSTLGKALVRLLAPTHGSILFGGTDIGKLGSAAMRELRTDLQIVFQDPLSSLNPRLTIASTLTEPMAAHGIGNSHKEREDLAAALLQDVQLPVDYLWRYPHEMSGGQRQRIGIARALAVNPKLIVCDEVTSALDVSVQAELLTLLLELRERLGLTLLFITHNISVVEYISDRTAVMYQGRLVEFGATADVCGNPQHEYTQKLLASVPRLHALGNAL